MRRRSIAIALAALILVGGAWADDLRFGFEGARFFNGVIPGGLDLSLTYYGLSLSDEADTKLFLKGGGGYENASLLRDPLTGDPWLSTVKGNEYYMANFQWELAFIQGFSRRADGVNLLEAFLFYRGRYDRYLNELSTAIFPDARELFGTSFMAGISYDSRVQSRHRAKEGLYAEASAEWGPGFLNTTDFWRVSGQLRGFLPVLDLPTEGGNLFNIYLAGFLGADYAAGAKVPVYVNQSFGGRSLRDSLGNSVRGYFHPKYDTALKTAASAEVRLVGPSPSLLWPSVELIEKVVPYLFGFADAGYYAGFNGASTAYANASGFLASVGGGLALDLIGFAQASVIAGVRLVDDAAVPYLYDPENYFFAVKFFLHF